MLKTQKIRPFLFLVYWQGKLSFENTIH